MLQPWMNVFEHGEMDAFLVNNIVPKLQIALQEFIINPHQQRLGKNITFSVIVVISCIYSIVYG